MSRPPPPRSPHVPEFPHFGEGVPLQLEIDRTITNDYDHGLRPNHNHGKHPEHNPKRVQRLAPLPGRASTAALPPVQGPWWRGPGEILRETTLSDGTRRPGAGAGLEDDGDAVGGGGGGGGGGALGHAVTGVKGIHDTAGNVITRGAAVGTAPSSSYLSIDHRKGFMVERRALGYKERGYSVSYYVFVAAATAVLVLACLASSLGVASRFGQLAVRETVDAFQPSSAQAVSLTVSGSLSPARMAVEVLRQAAASVDPAGMDAMLRGAVAGSDAVSSAFAFEVDPRSSLASPRLLSFQRTAKADATTGASQAPQVVHIDRYDPGTGRLLRDGLSISANFSLALEPWWRSVSLAGLAAGNWTSSFVVVDSPGLFVAFLAKDARAGGYVGVRVSLTALSRSIHGSARATGLLAAVDLRDNVVLAHSASPDGLVGRDTAAGASAVSFSVADAGTIDPRLKDLTQAFKCLSLMDSRAPLAARGFTVCDPGIMAEGLSVSWSATSLSGLPRAPEPPYFSTGATPAILSVSVARYEAFLGPNRKGIYYTVIILALVCLVGVVLQMACATAVVWPIRELSALISGQEPTYANYSEKRTSVVSQIAGLQRALAGKIEIDLKQSLPRKK